MTCFKLPTPLVQAIGTVSIPPAGHDDPAIIERKPVAAAVVTLSQRPDGHVDIFSETVSAVAETQFPLAPMLDRELVASAPTLVAPLDLTILAADAARSRFFVEPKIAALLDGEHAIDVTRLAAPGGAVPPDEAALCRRLQVPHLTHGEGDAARIWTWSACGDRAAVLGAWALGHAVTRLMLWSNLMAMRHAEPGWLYEPMLGLRSWLNERETDAPELYRWATCKPVMRAVSFEDDYRADLALRQAGKPGNWPEFAEGLFYS